MEMPSVFMKVFYFGREVSDAGGVGVGVGGGGRKSFQPENWML